MHEWVPDKTFKWRNLPEVLKLQEDFYLNNGEYPEGEDRLWEPRSKVQKRALEVLRKYYEHESILVICHGMLIESLTNKKDIKFVDLIPYISCT